MSFARRLVGEHPHLLSPETLCGPLGPFSLVRAVNASEVAGRLEESAARVANLRIQEVPLEVVVDARPPHHPQVLAASRNKRIGDDTARTLALVQNQQYDPSAVRVTVLANEGFRGRLNRGQRETLGAAEVIELPPDATNAEALNVAYAQRSPHAAIMAVTTAGTTYATNQAFRAAAHSLKSGRVAGLYGPRLCDERASRAEVEHFGGSGEMNDDFASMVVRAESANGFMAADGAFMSVNVLNASGDAPFNTAYERGGAVRAWALGATASGCTVQYSPAAAVQRSEGLNELQLLSDLHEVVDWETPSVWPS